MQFEPDYWYHVYNRGNNCQQIYFKSKNYLFFIRKIRKQVAPLADVIAYCLMPNHFHLLIHVKRADTDEKIVERHPLIQKIAIMLSSYTKAINNQERRSGSLFKAKTKAKNLSTGDRNYADTCFYYIHQNPLRAGLVETPEAWPFSSYRDYAGLRKGTLPAKALGFKAFQITGKQHFIHRSKQSLNQKLVDKIFF